MWVIKGFINTIFDHFLYVLYCSDPPCRLTYDCGGFDGVNHLLQGLNVRMLVSELLLLVVKMASSLHLWKRSFFFYFSKTPHFAVW